MKRELKRNVMMTGILFVVFVIFTVGVLTVDVRPIGPQQSKIGFAAVNEAVFGLIGVNLRWYDLTDWLGIVVIMVALGFAVWGFVQLIRRKSLKLVDQSILALGFVYVLAAAAYVLFELWIVNYRPLILVSDLEASYPSSHTMMVVCIMGTAIIQGQLLVRHKAARTIINLLCAAVIGITVIGRLLSGVHWFTDIAGGVLLGICFIWLYHTLVVWQNSTKR